MTGGHKRMKKVTLLVTPILALVIVAAAFASTDSRGPAARTAKASSLATAKVRCGTLRTLGIAAPITGPAASIGQQQLRWAQVLRRALEQGAQETRIASSRATPSSASTRRSRCRVAQSFKSKSSGPCGRRPRRQPGGRGVDERVQERRSRVHLRLGDARHADGRPYRRQPHGLLLPRRAERQRPGPDGRELHHQQAEVEAGLHHRRPGDLLAGPGRRRAGDPEGAGRHRPA